CIQFFISVVGPTKKYHQTDATTAELAKYVENVFYATKITFCYEIDQICKKLGVDYYKMREAWLMDPRVNPMHTAVFEENTHPYSGRCLPKDISAFVEASHKLGYEPSLLREVMNSNDRIGNIRKNNQ